MSDILFSSDLKSSLGSGAREGTVADRIQALQRQQAIDRAPTPKPTRSPVRDRRPPTNASEFWKAAEIKSPSSTLPRPPKAVSPYVSNDAYTPRKPGHLRERTGSIGKSSESSPEKLIVSPKRRPLAKLKDVFESPSVEKASPPKRPISRPTFPIADEQLPKTPPEQESRREKSWKETIRSNARNRQHADAPKIPEIQSRFSTSIQTESQRPMSPPSRYEVQQPIYPSGHEIQRPISTSIKTGTEGSFSPLSRRDTQRPYSPLSRTQTVQPLKLAPLGTDVWPTIKPILKPVESPPKAPSPQVDLTEQIRDMIDRAIEGRGDFSGNFSDYTTPEEHESLPSRKDSESRVTTKPPKFPMPVAEPKVVEYKGMKHKQATHAPASTYLDYTTFPPRPMYVRQSPVEEEIMHSIEKDSLDGEGPRHVRLDSPSPEPLDSPLRNYGRQAAREARYSPRKAKARSPSRPPSRSPSIQPPQQKDRHVPSPIRYEFYARELALPEPPSPSPDAQILDHIPVTPLNRGSPSKRRWWKLVHNDDGGEPSNEDREISNREAKEQLLASKGIGWQLHPLGVCGDQCEGYGDDVFSSGMERPIPKPNRNIKAFASSHGQDGAADSPPATVGAATVEIDSPRYERVIRSTPVGSSGVPSPSTPGKRGVRIKISKNGLKGSVSPTKEDGRVSYTVSGNNGNNSAGESDFEVVVTMEEGPNEVVTVEVTPTPSPQR